MNAALRGADLFCGCFEMYIISVAKRIIDTSHAIAIGKKLEPYAKANNSLISFKKLITPYLPTKNSENMKIIQKGNISSGE